MNTVKINSLGCLFLLLGFGTIGYAQPKADLQEFGQNPYADGNAILPQDYLTNLDDLYKRLGTPKKVEETKEYTQMWGNGAEDDKQVLISYDDIFLLYYFSASKQEYMLFLFQIHDPKRPLKYGVKMGMKEAEVVKIFGPPISRDDFGSSYELVYLPKDWLGSLNFSFRDDKLNAINIHSGD